MKWRAGPVEPVYRQNMKLKGGLFTMVLVGYRVRPLVDLTKDEPAPTLAAMPTPLADEAERQRPFISRLRMRLGRWHRSEQEH